MSLRVCGVPGCGALSDKPKCREHRQQAEQQRGSRQARGYDAEHDARRAADAPLVATGRVKCWRCGDYITAGQQWDEGHDDRDRTVYRGPEHALKQDCKAGGNRATRRLDRR